MFVCNVTLGSENREIFHLRVKLVGVTFMEGNSFNGIKLDWMYIFISFITYPDWIKLE